jgi:hypothetical protein
VDLDEILYGDDDIEDNLVAYFNSVASNIPKWRAFKLILGVGELVFSHNFLHLGNIYRIML